jgi:hypothetical protein
VLEATYCSSSLESIHDWHVDIHQYNFQPDGQLGIRIMAAVQRMLLFRKPFVDLHGLVAVLRRAINMSGFFSKDFKKAEINSLLDWSVKFAKTSFDKFLRYHPLARGILSPYSRTV